MQKRQTVSRRTVLKTGAAAAAAGMMATPIQAVPPRQPGETRVVFLVGDIWHNPIMQENHWRRLLGPTGWRLMFAQSAQFITPAVLDEADLFVFARYEGGDSLAWSPDRFVEDRSGNPSSYFMSEEIEDAIVENVTERGMGLMPIHCSVVQPERARYNRLIGMQEYVPHTKVQPAHIHDLNPSHPITRGMEPFDIDDDEIFDAVMIPGEYELLFRTRGKEEPVDAIGGWCREAGNGRVVALLPGHIPSPYMKGRYKQIMWRAAHWALKRDIPDGDHISDGY